MEVLNSGDIHRVKYPFVQEDVTLPDENGVHAVKSWRPGCAAEQGDDIYGECYFFAEKEGEMILEIISIHKPGKYPERVFYTRKWQAPDGHIFGKPGLRITTTQNYRALIKGYRHEFEWA